MDLCARRPAIRRSCPASRHLLLRAGSHRRASVQASASLQRYPASRRLCRVRGPLPARPHARPDPRSGLLGARAAQTVRAGRGGESAVGGRGGAADRCHLRRRARVQWRERGAAPGATTGTSGAAGCFAGTVDAGRAGEAVAPCRRRQGDGLHAEALGCVYWLSARRADLSNQQRGGAQPARCGNARVIVQLLFKYLETLEVDSRWRCDTGALYAQRPPPRTACPGRQRGSGTARRERLARREGCQP
jgi:hypothetical protein